MAAHFIALLIARSAQYVEHAGEFCVGNHPNTPIYVSNESAAQCRAHCDAASECACYDTTSRADQQACRLTSAGALGTARSSSGYTAYTRAGAPTNGSAVAASLTVGPVGSAGPADDALAAGGGGRPFAHFWRSCGWCPPDPHPLFGAFFARDDVWQNHALVGSTPHGGIAFVRIHYLLDLLQPANASTPTRHVAGVGLPGGYVSRRLRALAAAGAAAGNANAAALDWGALDAAMAALHEQGLSPGFEIMGNPGALADRSDRLFTSFKDPAQILGWRDLTQAVAARYLRRFGAAAVGAWRWESWNEPDGQCKRNLTVGIECDQPSFLAYWDACAAGLKAAAAEHARSIGAEAAPPLVFGGPAADGKKEFLYALVAHCLNGTNAIDGSVGCGGTPAFLNAHLKGRASSQRIVDLEKPIAQTVTAMVAGTPLAAAAWGNDEADPLVGWSHLYEWRADARYAALVPRVVAQHQAEMVEAVGVLPAGGYDVLSNDNGFLPYADNGAATFFQRTLVARWALNASATPNATRDSFELVRKPVLNAMALLARLGDTAYDASTGGGGGVLPASTATLGLLGTSRGFGGSGAATTTAELAALVYNSDDSAAPTADPSTRASVALRFNLTVAAAARLGADARVALFRLDQSHGNAYATWQAMGLPKLPTPQQFSLLREAAEVVVEPGYPAPFDNAAAVVFDVPRPGIVLAHVCAKPAVAPAAPTNVRLHLPGRAWDGAPTQKLLVLWDAENDATHRCISTFAVRCGALGRVNVADTIFTSFAHAQDYPAGDGGPSGAACCYSVSAIDYWGRSSAPSAIVCPPVAPH